VGWYQGLCRPCSGRALLCRAGRGRRGRQGAHGFRAQSRWARKVGAFINLESTGPGGPDYVFQARPPPARLRQPPCCLQPEDTDPNTTLELERRARKRDVSAARAGHVGAGQGRTGACGGRVAPAAHPVIWPRAAAWRVLDARVKWHTPAARRPPAAGRWARTRGPRRTRAARWSRRTSSARACCRPTPTSASSPPACSGAPPTRRQPAQARRPTRRQPAQARRRARRQPAQARRRARRQPAYARAALARGQARRGRGMSLGAPRGCGGLQTVGAAGSCRCASRGRRAAGVGGGGGRQLAAGPALGLLGGAGLSLPGAHLAALLDARERIAQTEDSWHGGRDTVQRRGGPRRQGSVRRPRARVRRRG